MNKKRKLEKENNNDNIKCKHIKAKDINYSFNLIKGSYFDDYEDYLDNTFVIFKSINNIYCLVYSNDNFSIIFYDLIENKKINEIKEAHSWIICSFSYYLDDINNRDLLLSICNDNNNKNYGMLIIMNVYLI